MMALGGLALSGIGLGMQTRFPAFGAELDGFAINTQDKAVTITLFTDQRVPYTTEHQGKQFTIVLPGTQLSQEQIDSGLPVVIDNKNRFIGRAVPTEDGKVKIILPNLPASDYAVSIQQKRNGQVSSTPASEPAESIQPRPAVSQSQNETSQFEKVAANFPKPAKRKVASAPKHINRTTGSVKLSPAPNQPANTAMASNGTLSGNGSMWNPYVVKHSAVPTIASNNTYNNYRPTTEQQKATHSAWQGDDPINTISVAESLQGNAALPGMNAGNPNAASSSDPLWYLHSLPPASPGSVPADSLQGPAQNLPAIVAPGTKTEAQPSKPGISTTKMLTQGLRDAISAIPRWLLITMAVFLAGIGLFSSIGGLVLLRVLFSHTKQQLMPNAMYAQGMATQPTGTDSQKSGYASRPGVSQLAFEDKTSVSSLDYLKGSPNNITQAVQNTVLVKFPSHKKHRTHLKHRPSLKNQRTAAYTAKP